MTVNPNTKMPKWLLYGRIGKGLLVVLITAAILGIARVAGETAPLLLTAFGNTAFNANPVSDSMSALPLYVFSQMLLGGDNDVARAWVACLVLMIIVAVLFTTARVVANKMKKA